MNQKTSKKNLQLAKKNDISASTNNLPTTASEQYFAMANIALQNGDMDQLKQMMELQREHEADEARKEFYKAFAEFKANAPIVTKDMKNSQYGGSLYTSRGHLVNTVSPALSQYGLSTSWDILEQTPDSITIACILTHALGHSISVKMTAPPDRGAKNSNGNYGKNPIQAIKSTKTYLEVATFESVTGTATSDYGDDDGNNYSAPTPPKLISEEQATELWAYVQDNEIEGVLNRLLKTANIEKIEDILEENFDKAIALLKQSAENKNK